MVRALYILALALLLGLTGCVQARLNAYYNPKPPEPCQVLVVGDIVPRPDRRACISREHTLQVLEDLTK